MQEQKINRREILKMLVTLSIPTILEEILSTLLQYVDTAMVGHLGEKATASVSVTTTVTWLVNSIPAALGVAVLSMTAKALGSGDREYLQKIAKQILILVFACGLFAGGISVILSPYIPIWMGAEPSIWKDASDYFLIVSLPMIFRSATMIMGAAIRGSKRYKNADVNQSGSQRNQYPFQTLSLFMEWVWASEERQLRPQYPIRQPDC